MFDTSVPDSAEITIPASGTSASPTQLAKAKSPSGTVEVMNGNCVQLGGTHGHGNLVTTSPITFTSPGAYTLSFLLGGSQQPGDVTDTTQVTLGNLLNVTPNTPANAPLSLVTQNFNVASPTTATLSFSNQGGSANCGAILDDVSVGILGATATPEPASFAFLGIGLAFLALLKTR